MTKTQLKKTFANIAGVEVNGRGKKWVIETEDESAKDVVFKILRAMRVAVGGYQCGHGGWVLTPD